MKYLRGAFYGLVTFAIYFGFNLLGWGLDDLQGFFALPSRSVYALIVAIFSLAIGIQAVDAPEGIQGGHGEADKRVRRQTLVAAAMSSMLFVSLIFLPFADRRSIGVLADGEAFRWLGLVLCAPGYALIFWSGLALGKQYSAEVTIQKDHELITAGLYRYIRHPRYLGVIGLALGVALVFHSWIGLAVGIFVSGILVLRISDEEALMHREFGPTWEAYCKQSWRLIPYLY